MRRLITDFDGPIMDVSERYYRVYQFCLEQTKHSTQPIYLLSKSEFWRLKRARVPEQQIGLLSGLDKIQANQFAQLRRQTVHTLPYLRYDCPITGAIETLEKIQSLEVELVVMTMRRERELEVAFAQYDLKRFFPSDRCYCLSDDYIKTNDVQDKSMLMKRAMQELLPVCDVWMIGDTEADIIAAQTHQVRVIGLLSGIRDRSQLEYYQPDWIANNIVDAFTWMTKTTPTLS
jgi:phosphoglycolate phosphatase-like HAD superfamily hydrolase